MAIDFKDMLVEITRLWLWFVTNILLHIRDCIRDKHKK